MDSGVPIEPYSSQILAQIPGTRVIGRGGGIVDSRVILVALDPWIRHGSDTRRAAWGARALNDALAEVQREDPGRAYGMAHVPLQSPHAAVSKLERVAEQNGFRAVQIGTNVNDADLDDAKADPFWDAAQSLGLLVFVHPHNQTEGLAGISEEEKGESPGREPAAPSGPPRGWRPMIRLLTRSTRRVLERGASAILTD